MGTGIREKLDEGRTIIGAPKLDSDKVVRQTLDSLLPDTNFTRSSCQTSQVVNRSMPRRKTYSNREKLHILDGIDELLQSGERHSFRACCRAVGIQPGQARRWRALRNKMDRFDAINRSSLHPGRSSILEPLQEPLLQWFFELREQGFMVSVRLITLKACELSGVFRRKGARAKDMTVRRFLARHRIVLRAVTHECQRPPETLRQEAKDFISFAKSKLTGVNRCQKYILNMDQTPIFFDMSSGRTLNTAGERTVNGRTSTSATMRVTVAVTVTASGDFLKPIIIFKGKPGARIERNEFPTFHDSNFYACQERAWMDERVMRMWIHLVLKPHVETAPPEIQPVLLLDSYRCHLMATVVNDIEDLGVEIIHIPGGCTGLCQPVDIGIGKPLKSRARQLWESWMIENGIDSAVSRPPSRMMLTEWITESVEGIRLSSTIVKNSWRHADYSYFPPINEGEEVTRNEQEQAPRQEQAIDD